MRELYEEIKAAKEFVDFTYLSGEPSSIKFAEKHLIKLKRKLREHLHEKNGWEVRYENARVKVLHNKEDSVFLKLFFPNEHWNAREKDAFRKENWIKPVLGPHDCTGRVFTEFMNIFETPAGMFVYIWEAEDY